MSLFETITKGPSNASGQNAPAVPNGLSFDQQNNVLASVGSAGTEGVLETVLAVFQTATALTTITTAQTLLSQVLNSWFLNRLNRTLRLSGWLIYTSPGTTQPTVTLTLKIGSTTLVALVTAGVSATASTNMPVHFEFEFSITATGSTVASIQAKGKAEANISANTPAAAAAIYLDTNVAVVGSLNLQQALTLALTIAASSTMISAQLQFAKLEVLA